MVLPGNARGIVLFIASHFKFKNRLSPTCGEKYQKSTLLPCIAMRFWLKLLRKQEE
jgi:hypothetical protein